MTPQLARQGIATTRPTNQQLIERYRTLHDARGTPHALPGATRTCWRSKPCNDALQCVYCWERQARLNALRIALFHVGQANIHQISIPVPTLQDPATAHRLLRRVSRSLERSGDFTRRTLWIHPFHENPALGPWPHIAGFISGTDADPDTLHPSQAWSLRRVLRPHMLHGDLLLPIPIYSRALHASSKRHTRDLLLAGYEAAQPSYPTRRIHAGLYHARGQLRVRYTNAHACSHPNRLHDTTDPTGSPLPDWTQATLERTLKLAKKWHPHTRTPNLPYNVKLQRHHLDRVLQATPWRARFGLLTDAQLIDQYTT